MSLYLFVLYTTVQSICNKNWKNLLIKMFIHVMFSLQYHKVLEVLPPFLHDKLVNEERDWTGLRSTNNQKVHRLQWGGSKQILLHIHTFVHLFSHLASSALVVRSWQAISRSMLPHLHLTIVVRGHTGHGPLWQSIWHKCGSPETKLSIAT